MDQHRRFNLNCIQWQCYNAAHGHMTWDEARAEAVSIKQRREAQAVADQAGTVSMGSFFRARDEARADKRRAEVPEPPEVPAHELEADVEIVDDHKKKKKKDRKKKSRKDAEGSPEVERTRRRRRRPSTDEEPDEGDAAAKKKHKHRPRQLVITLPDNLRF